jgi:hypothetical protein
MTEFVDHVGASHAQMSAPPLCVEASEIMPILVTALGPAWSVHEEVDPDGDSSVVVLPAQLDRSEAFILYADGIHIVVAMIIDEQWTSTRRFQSLHEVVVALVAQASRLAPA